eukprot:3178326-Pyramimonas_sp.AAC.1
MCSHLCAGTSEPPIAPSSGKRRVSLVSIQFHSGWGQRRFLISKVTHLCRPTDFDCSACQRSASALAAA